MKVQYGRDRYELDRDLTVRRLLEQLDIAPEGVIVVVNGDLVTADTELGADDDVETVRAISGGAARGDS